MFPRCDVLDPSSLYISAPMDEVDSGKVRIGQPVRVSIDSYRDQSFLACKTGKRR